MPKIILLVIFSFSVFFAHSIYAENSFASGYNFTYVTMDNGISNNFIEDIYKDSQGFLWFSTGGGGLARYDGYEFINFNTNSSKARLKNNFVKEVCEDDFGRLWIVSEGGIDILDLSTFKTVDFETNNPVFLRLLKDPIITTKKDSKGAMWFYGNGAVSKIVFDKKGNIQQVYDLQLNQTTYHWCKLKDVDEDGSVWIAVGNSFYKIYLTEDGKLRHKNPLPGLSFDANTQIITFSIYNNDVWVGTNNGLIKYNANENIKKTFRHNANDNKSITQDFISDIATTSTNQLLFSTLKGINVYNPLNESIEHITQLETNAKSTINGLNSNFINCTFIDGDVIWIGTETGGVNKMTPRRLSFRNFTHNKDNPFSLSQNPVNAIYEDNQETLWIGTVEGGLNRKLKGSDSFTHYISEKEPFISHNSVSAITSDNSNRLWVGSWGKGITLLDIKQPSKKALAYISSANYPNFAVDFIGSLTYDKTNNLVWIGANPGIFYYNLNDNTLHSLLSAGQSEQSLGAMGGMIDSKDRLWMGSINGLHVVDLKSRRGNNFSYKFTKNKSEDGQASIEKPVCFCEASDGTIWIGSNGYGIYKFTENSKGEKYTSYTTKNGLINDNVKGIVEDNKGRIWISTNNGLSCFYPATESFVNYTKEDGLPSNQFYWNAYSRSKGGLLYFGGLDGLLAIDANQLLRPQALSKVTLTTLKIMNEDVYPDGKHLDMSISKAQTLRLHESEKSFSIEFSALNYNSQSTAVYKYRLLGFDDKWIEVPATRRFASYTNLPAGEYTFQVQYVPEGIVNDIPITELSIIVTPFFYKQSWFIALIALMIAVSIYYWYRRRVNTLKEQKELLHKTVVERTKELEKQNEMLVEQNDKITLQKEQLLEMSERVETLTADKISFFTNITHEFRTPITLIIGPIERALKLSYNPQVIEQLNFVERNSKYLLSLVNQLMDFRKVESGNLEIHKTKSDFLKFVDTIVEPFVVFAESRNVAIQKYFRLQSPELLFDQDAMHKAITNLLSNAIKYTPDGGTVSIYITSLRNKTDNAESLYICIKDTGSGVADKDLSLIFERFYQSDDHAKYPIYGQSGTGIGLYLTQQIVQLHGGKIKAKNNKTRGASFCIELPLLRDGENAEQDNTSTTNEQVFNNANVSNQNTDYFKPNKLTILIVEDNIDMRGFIRSILSQNYNVLEAENGAEALAVMKTSNVDFIISDLMMPVMDGIELAEKVKNNLAISHIPILMLTAKTSQEARLESYKVGVESFLQKPFSDELLLMRIQNILDNRKRFQQQFAVKMDVEALNIEEDSKDKKFLNKVFELIKNNYQNSSYEVSDFINDMGGSKSFLNNKMQQLTGQPIGQFIRNYRLTIARELIEKNKTTRNMNISEIAYDVGFNDPKYFTRCFTKRYNVTPSAMLEQED